MPPNRRDAIKTLLAAPVVLAIPAAAKPSKDGDRVSEKIEMIAQIEPTAGKVVSMVHYHDDIFIATEYGKIYRLFDLYDNFV